MSLTGLQTRADFNSPRFSQFLYASMDFHAWGMCFRVGDSFVIHYFLNCCLHPWPKSYDTDWAWLVGQNLIERSNGILVILDRLTDIMLNYTDVCKHTSTHMTINQSLLHVWWLIFRLAVKFGRNCTRVRICHFFPPLFLYFLLTNSFARTCMLLGFRSWTHGMGFPKSQNMNSRFIDCVWGKQSNDHWQGLIEVDLTNSNRTPYTPPLFHVVRGLVRSSVRDAFMTHVRTGSKLPQNIWSCMYHTSFVMYTWPFGFSICLPIHLSIYLSGIFCSNCLFDFNFATRCLPSTQ